jgi:hypothetical protein
MPFPFPFQEIPTYIKPRPDEFGCAKCGRTSVLNSDEIAKVEGNKPIDCPQSKGEVKTHILRPVRLSSQRK